MRSWRLEVKRCVWNEDTLKVVLWMNYGWWDRRESEIQITGFLAGPRFWFKPMEKRIAIAKNMLTKIAHKLNEIEDKLKAKEHYADQILREIE